jgi:3',5'-cyclic-nucleotide phosphodiesterase
MRARPLTVYASAATIDTLKRHIFNNAIWPDFTRIPTPEKGVMRYQEIHSEQPVVLGGREILPVEVEHTVHAFGFLAHNGGQRWAFSGDTHRTDRFYELINSFGNVSRLFIEAAFPDKEEWIADLSKHLCPNLLFDELKKLDPACEVWISHLKPKDHQIIRQQLLQPASDDVSHRVQLLAAGMAFDF